MENCSKYINCRTCEKKPKLTVICNDFFIEDMVIYEQELVGMSLNLQIFAIKNGRETIILI